MNPQLTVAFFHAVGILESFDRLTLIRLQQPRAKSAKGQWKWRIMSSLRCQILTRCTSWTTLRNQSTENGLSLQDKTLGVNQGVGRAWTISNCEVIFKWNAQVTSLTLMNGWTMRLVRPACCAAKGFDQTAATCSVAQGGTTAVTVEFWRAGSAPSFGCTVWDAALTAKITVEASMKYKTNCPCRLVNSVTRLQLSSSGRSKS